MGSGGRKDASCPSVGGPGKGPALSRGGQKAWRGRREPAVWDTEATEVQSSHTRL